MTERVYVEQNFMLRECLVSLLATMHKGQKVATRTVTHGSTRFFHKLVRTGATVLFIQETIGRKGYYERHCSTRTSDDTTVITRHSYHPQSNVLTWKDEPRFE